MSEVNRRFGLNELVLLNFLNEIQQRSFKGLLGILCKRSMELGYFIWFNGNNRGRPLEEPRAMMSSKGPGYYQKSFNFNFYYQT